MSTLILPENLIYSDFCKRMNINYIPLPYSNKYFNLRDRKNIFGENYENIFKYNLSISIVNFYENENIEISEISKNIDYIRYFDYDNITNIFTNDSLCIVKRFK